MDVQTLQKMDGCNLIGLVAIMCALTQVIEREILPQVKHITKSQYLLEAENTPTGNAINAQPNWFTAHYWQQQQAITGQSVGRSITYFVKHNQQDWVLRHYFRGGLIGKLLKDQYLFLGLKNTRVYREFSLLEQLSQQGLNVPKPIAAQVTRQGCYYQADILIEKIAGATDLFHLLKKQPLSQSSWQTIGQTLAQFHKAGVFHADLNIHNIMLDQQGKTWLIDFDRGQQIKPNALWQKANIRRLLTSFEKEKNKHPELHWDNSAWQALLAGYQA